MSDEYKPEVGDVVSVELEVEHVYGDGSFDLKALSRFGSPIPSGKDPKIKLVRRKPPVLEPGDVVRRASGTYLVGARKVHYVATGGETLELGETPASLAERVARHRDEYTVIKHEGNIK